EELRSVHLDGEHEARAHGSPVHPHGARAAHPMLAAHVRACEPEPMPEEVGEQQSRLDVLAVAPAVHGDVDRDHAARSLARSTARSTSTRARCFRYAGDACTDPQGSIWSAADWPGRS